MVDETKVRKGKTSRAQGNAFEVRVREDLEEKGWICDKWSNNVEFMNLGQINEKELKLNWKPNIFGNPDSPALGRIVKAKPKYLFINGSMRMVGNNSGFPDFIAFRPVELEVGEVFGVKIKTKPYEVIGIEAKMTGELDRSEKDKCRWLLDQGIFNQILIAEKTKVKNRVVIVYHDFKKKYHRFYK